MQHLLSIVTNPLQARNEVLRAKEPPAAVPAASAPGPGDVASAPGSPALVRGFSALMSFSFTMTAVGVLPSLCTNWGNAIATGGPSVILYGWLICAFCTTVSGCAMAELNARYPNAGSVYYWSAMLAPRRYAAVLAYACGVLNLAGNAAAVAAFAYGFGNFVAGAVAASSGGDVRLSPGGTVGLAMAVTVCWAVLNALHIDQQGWLNNLAALWMALATLIIAAVLLAVPLDPGLPPGWAWRTPYSATGFEDSSQYSGYVYLLGLLNALFAMSGYEAGTHLAEETHDTSASSWGIVHTCLVTSAIGLLLILGLLAGTPLAVGVSFAQWAAAGGLPVGGSDDDPLVAPGDASVEAFLRHALLLTSQRGAIGVLYAAAGTAGGAALAALLIVSAFFTGVSSLTATSRMCYAMARDGALPCSAALTYIWPATATPLGTVLATLLMACALLLLGLVSSQGLTAVLSITVIGFQLSYAMPLVLRLLLGGGFQAHASFDLGWLSAPAHAVGAGWLLFTSLVLCWPTAWPVQGSNMNYTVVVLAGVLLAGAGYWAVEGRRSFRGPREAAEEEEQAARVEADRRGNALEMLTSQAAAMYRGGRLEEEEEERAGGTASSTQTPEWS